ncbi:MAG TPA: ATP-binding protein [Firmicutes bacterium]|nr:ATP-binding protein [Bacillota bacterium]
MRELSLHVLDIAQNSLAAGATYVEIEITEDRSQDRLTIAIRDNGRGMSQDLAARASDPFVTTRETRKVGLGLPLFAASAAACDGGLTISSAEGVGTTVVASFRASHIDRAPLGDMGSTIAAILACNPGVRVRYVHRVLGPGGAGGLSGPSERRFEFDSEDVQSKLGDVPISNPRVITFIRGMIQQEISALSGGE